MLSIYYEKRKKVAKQNSTTHEFSKLTKNAFFSKIVSRMFEGGQLSGTKTNSWGKMTLKL